MGGREVSVGVNLLGLHRGNFRQHRIESSGQRANLIRAALVLHEVSSHEVSRESTYLADAVRWTDVLQRHYWLPELGGYAFTADDTAGLIVRPF